MTLVTSRGPCFGISGSRVATPETTAIIEDWVASLPMSSTIYHGACVGVDAAVANAAYRAGLNVIAVVPATTGLVDRDAVMSYSLAVIYAPPGSGKENDYRARNKLLVHQVRMQQGRLKAFWNGNKRSGTFMTINIARRANVPVDIQEI